jgi:release factor glutamine methyltransferase
MKIKDALADLQGRLSSAGVSEASLEAELLMRNILVLDAVQLFLAHDTELTATQSKFLNTLVERRLSGEPLAYITGTREFYGREFAVNRHVLIPRPETEHLVEKALEIASQIPSPVIADIGTGSGVIAVSLAAELPRARLFAIDISNPALDIARLNACRHGVESRIMFLYGDLTAVLPEPVDIFVANLPYVNSSDCKASPEPRLALDGGIEGLDVIRRFCTGLQGKLRPGGWVLLEIGRGQEETVQLLLREAMPGARVGTMKDMAGIERVVWGRIETIEEKPVQNFLNNSKPVKL